MSRRKQGVRSLVITLQLHLICSPRLGQTPTASTSYTTVSHVLDAFADWLQNMTALLEKLRTTALATNAL